MYLKSCNSLLNNTILKSIYFSSFFHQSFNFYCISRSRFSTSSLANICDSQPSSVSNSLYTFLPYTQNPNNLVNIICSNFKNGKKPNFSILEKDLNGVISHLGTQEISRVLLRCQSDSYTALCFFNWVRNDLCISPNVHNYCVLVHILAWSKNFFQAMTLLLEVIELSRSVSGDSDVFRMLVFCTDECSWEPVIFEMLVKAYVKKGMVREGFITFKKMVKFGLVPNVVTVNCLLNGLSKFNYVDRCWYLFEEMGKIGVRANCFTFNILTHVLCKGEDVDKVNKFLDEMEEEGFIPDVVTYNTLIDSYCKKLVRLDLSNNKGLRANLPTSIGNLKKLDTLMLVGCSLFGQIPESIGSLQNLIYIGLNSNSFTGPIPHSIGNLSKLSWLDLSDNKLNGSLPVSSEIEPGLDLLLKARHFHFSKNQLSGDIQTQLFSSKMQLLHVVLDQNNFTGGIPNTLGLVQTLKTVRLDRNSLTGPVPKTLSNLSNVNELFLSNNNLDGPFPNLNGMVSLNYMDLSNNSFDPTEVPTWFSNFQNLTTLLLEKTQLQGEIPSDLFGLRRLESVVLSNNNLSGTLDIGSGYSSNLKLKLDNNSITGFQQGAQYNLSLTLDGNPICRGTGARGDYCTKIQLFIPSSSCFPVVCSSDNVNGLICRHANTKLKPYTGTINFFAFSFSNLERSIYYESLNQSLMKAFSTSTLPVGSVSLCNPFVDIYSHLQVKIQVFPSGGDSFNRTGIIDVGNTLNRQLFPLGAYFGPFTFIHDIYEFPGENKSSNAGLIVGATIGSLVFVLLICAGLYTFVLKKRVKEAIKNSSPFASWNPDNRSGGVPQLQGAKWISFEELKKCTNNFSDESVIGSGGYGKVYRGQLTSGDLVAIKRAQHGSLQGDHEFKTEIELLSRIHHKNVVSLVGFCYEQGEQILIYEFISNGTLKRNLSGESGIRLDWMRRIKITLDSARGLAYMHELANPPIIHRDIKSTNILLDDKLNAKVADFGISKPVSDIAKGYITTQVKGTMGYMDPEYYMTNQLTEKSDVYSFGIVMLELLTARAPIQHNKHIAGEVKEALGNFQNILDVKLGLASSLMGLEKYVTLAMKCVKETGAERPTMSEVVREIENIMQLETPDPDTESYSTSSIHDRGADRDLYHPYDDDAFDRSRTSVPFETGLR